MQFHCGSRNAREEGVKSVEERASDKTVMALLAPPSENTPVSPRRGLGLPPQLQRWRVVGLPSTLPDLPYWFPYCFPGPSLFFVIILNLLTGRSSSRGPRGAPHCSRDVDSLRSPPARLAGSAKLTSTPSMKKWSHRFAFSRGHHQKGMYVQSPPQLLRCMSGIFKRKNCLYLMKSKFILLT